MIERFHDISPEETQILCIQYDIKMYSNTRDALSR